MEWFWNVWMTVRWNDANRTVESVELLMAAACGEQSLDNDDHLLECAICMDKFVDPCVLPCSHTFCRQCLIQHYESCCAAEAADENDVIQCPTCRQTLPLPADIHSHKPSSSAAPEYQFNSADINQLQLHPSTGSLLTANVNSFFSFLSEIFVVLKNTNSLITQFRFCDKAYKSFNSCGYLEPYGTSLLWDGINKHQDGTF